MWFSGNALLSDQEEYLAAGVDQYVLRVVCRCSALLTDVSCSVLTKPVLEKSLKAMLCIADDRRRASAACAEVVDGRETPQS